MILERPKSRFDCTLFDLTLELTPPHDIFHRATFRVYSSNDLLGVELGGALKNVIGAGVCNRLRRQFQGGARHAGHRGNAQAGRRMRRTGANYASALQKV